MGPCKNLQIIGEAKIHHPQEKRQSPFYIWITFSQVYNSQSSGQNGAAMIIVFTQIEHCTKAFLRLRHIGNTKLMSVFNELMRNSVLL